jgi:hypothetical protein
MEEQPLLEIRQVEQCAGPGGIGSASILKRQPINYGSSEGIDEISAP